MITIRNKKKYSGSAADIERGKMYGHTKQIPRSHSGNSTKKEKRFGSGGWRGADVENTTVMVVDGKTGKVSWRHG